MVEIIFHTKSITTMQTNCLILIFCLFSIVSLAQKVEEDNIKVYAFGEGGTKKMTYDRRQQPQAVLLNNKIHLVYNGEAAANAHKMMPTLPYAITFNVNTETFSKPVQLPGVLSKDHHYGPVIWADNNDYLHVLSGCHRTPGTHVISRQKNNVGVQTTDWKPANQVAPSLSYPSVSQVINNQQLIYYRSGEHRSSWTYSISSDNGNTWFTPENSVVDLNNLDELSGKDHKNMDEASSYHTYLKSENEKYIHIAFMYYDDNKKELPEKSYNPLYKKNVGTLKTNLYYVKVDLENHVTTNFEGKELETPIVLDMANEHCKIWDTNWRGSGIPPDIIIDKNDNPAFLHVLTEEVFEKLNYYYVRYDGKEWKKTVIAPACHKWNCSHLQIDKNGILRAYLLMDKGYFESEDKGIMNSHGGGTRIEEWISLDQGETWNKSQTLFKAEGKYAGWRFNNIQPIKTKEGKIKEGFWLFYGWEEENSKVAQAKAFLLIED